MRFVPVPAVAQGRHKVLVEHLENARAKAEASPWNKVSGEGRIGVIASGISRAYLADALAENGWEKDVKVLELGSRGPAGKPAGGLYVRLRYGAGARRTPAAG